MSSAGPKATTSVGAAAASARARDLGVGVADDRELAMRREVLVERDEQPAERGRRPRERVAHEAEHGDAAALELVVAPDAREPQQDVREHRVAARRGMVVELLLARDELLAVGGRLEEAAALVVGEQLDRELASRCASRSQRGSPVATCSSIRP